MLELHHGAPTPDTLKMLIALAEKGLRFESRPVDTASFAQWSEEHRRLAPQGQLPVLVDDGEVMNESTFALEYLAEAYGPRLAPEDPAGWYDTQAWLATFDEKLNPNVNLLGWHQATTAEERAAYRERLNAVPGREKPAGWAAVFSDAEASEDQLQLARERVAQAVERIEAALGAGDWLVGGGYSIVDIGAFALVQGLPRLLPELVNAERTPLLLAWLERIASRPAVAQALAAREPAYAPPN